jgi:uncharacterized Zn finger protein (UPF0148 family)
MAPHPARSQRGRAADDVSATNPARSPARVGTMTYLHCPRCRLAVARKAARLGLVHCPRCLARGRVAVELFSSPLPPDSLYAETQPKAEGLPA